MAKTSLLVISCTFYNNSHFSDVQTIFIVNCNLYNNIGDDDKDWVNQVDQEPYLYRLYVGGAGQRGGDGEVHGSEHHHAGDVHRDDQVKLVFSPDVDHCLVHHIHQDGGQVGDHEDAGE